MFFWYSAPARICWLPKSAGGVCSWSVQPELPEGLWIDDDTGVIFGSPAASAEHRVYTVVATNGSGSDSFTLEFGVEGARKCSAEAATQSASCLACDGLGCSLCAKRQAAPAAEGRESLQSLHREAYVCRLEWRKERRPEHSGWTSHQGHS